MSEITCLYNCVEKNVFNIQLEHFVNLNILCNLSILLIGERKGPYFGLILHCSCSVFFTLAENCSP